MGWASVNGALECEGGMLDIEGGVLTMTEYVSKEGAASSFR